MIHVICTNISGLGDEAYESLYTAATPERKARADRYRRREDALRCLAAGALLGYVLGTNDYIVETGPAGKPYIKGKDAFFYNLSHSGSWVAIAYGDMEVGVDVEQLGWDDGKEKIARRFFTAEEQAFVFARTELREERFYRIWTGKESYLKYLGTGIQKALDSFSVLTAPPGVRFQTWILPGGCLTLCCPGETSGPEILDARKLL